MITLERIREIVRGTYYADGDTLWEPFERYTHDDVEQYMETDVFAWCKELGVEHIRKGA